jgi:hypothetical protein
MIIFSFDVETIGLYGGVFALGACVINEDGVELESLFLKTNHRYVSGTNLNFNFVALKILPSILTKDDNCMSELEIRTKFWNFYIQCKIKYPDMIVVVDCGYPCEAGFLRACVNDNISEREFLAPFPLHELGTLILSKGEDPKEERERAQNETPAHNPLCDARQSARLWLQYWRRQSPDWQKMTNVSFSQMKT